MTTFLHAGDCGDILAAMPVVRYFGGGVLMLQAADYTRVRLTPDKWCGLDILLKKQPYIVDVVEYQGGKPSMNLNDFRANMMRSLRRGEGRQTSLVDWQLLAHGVPLTEKNTPWLNVEPKVVAPVVINRTGAKRDHRFTYHNPAFPWHRVWKKYHDKAVFIGLPEEHEVFCAACGEVPYEKTADLHEAAQVIAGASLFIGNQSVCCWIAHAMHKPLVQEVWLQGPNSMIVRPGAHYGFDCNVTLPDL